MSERDPKVDPRPGDVLRRGNRTRRVLDVLPTYMEVAEVNETGRGMVELLPTFPWIKQWRKWATTAEVLKRAEDTEAR